MGSQQYTSCTSFTLAKWLQINFCHQNIYFLACTLHLQPHISADRSLKKIWDLMCMRRAETNLVNSIDYSSSLRGRRRSGISVLDLEQQGLSADGLKILLSLIFWPAWPIEVWNRHGKVGNFITLKLLLHPDLVDGINYSSGLRGHRRSGISVLDSEQQGLSADGLKVLLSLIFWPAGIPTL